MKRLTGRLLLLLAGAAAAWWAWDRSQHGDEERSPEPRPEPGPERKPEAEPEPVDVEEAAADDAPTEVEAPDDMTEPAEEPEDATAPESAPEAMELKGARFADPDATLAWVNGASEAALASAGVAPSAARVVVDHRPFADLEALAGTRGIGPKTLQALASV